MYPEDDIPNNGENKPTTQEGSRKHHVSPEPTGSPGITGGPIRGMEISDNQSPSPGPSWRSVPTIEISK